MSKLFPQVIKGEFQITGTNEVDVDLVCKLWCSPLWIISQWHNQFTLIKYTRKNSVARQIKTQISFEQFEAIRDTLNLKEYKSEIYKNGSTWKQ